MAAGIPAVGTTKYHTEMSAADYQAKLEAYNIAGYRLVKVAGYDLGRKFAAIWNKPN